MITKTIETSFRLVPNELAYEFCEMDAEEQADFFNFIAEFAKTWTTNSFSSQAVAICQGSQLTDGGKKVIADLFDGIKDS